MASHQDPSYLDNLLSYGLDPRARTIVLHGDLGHEDEHGKNPVTHAVRSLLYLDRSGPDPITLWISTPGGPSEEMFGLYDVIRTRRCKITTVGFGLVASAGVLILAAGDHRVATANCWLMSHAESVDFKLDETWTGEQRMAWQLRSEKRWARLMGRHTKRSALFWTKLHQGRTRELWLDADEMLQYGLVDEIMEEPA